MLHEGAPARSTIERVVVSRWKWILSCASFMESPCSLLPRCSRNRGCNTTRYDPGSCRLHDAAVARPASFYRMRMEARSACWIRMVPEARISKLVGVWGCSCEIVASCRQGCRNRPGQRPCLLLVRLLLPLQISNSRFSLSSRQSRWRVGMSPKG